jgi:hypothetical protein
MNIHRLATAALRAGPLGWPTWAAGGLFAQGSESIPLPLINVLTSGGSAVLVVYVVKVFLNDNRESQKIQAEQARETAQRQLEQITDALGKMSSRMEESNARHAQVEQTRYEQYQKLIDRVLTIQEGLTERLAELRVALEALTASTRNHEQTIAGIQHQQAEIQRQQAEIQKQLLEYQRVLLDIRKPAPPPGKTRPPRGDEP